VANEGEKENSVNVSAVLHCVGVGFSAIWDEGRKGRTTFSPRWPVLLGKPG